MWGELADDNSFKPFCFTIKRSVNITPKGLYLPFREMSKTCNGDRLVINCCINPFPVFPKYNKMVCNWLRILKTINHHLELNLGKEQGLEATLKTEGKKTYPNKLYFRLIPPSHPPTLSGEKAIWTDLVLSSRPSRLSLYCAALRQPAETTKETVWLN